MRIEFTKMHGLGNDFVLLDGFRQPIQLSGRQVRALADRHFGIGCDQVLLIEPDADPGVDVRYRIFNAEGEEVEQCGNGARCIARYLVEAGRAVRAEIRAATMTGIITLYPEGGDRVRVNMGVPFFEPAGIPLLAEQRRSGYSVDTGAGQVEFMAVSMGNPHAVIVVPDSAAAKVERVAAALQASQCFPQGVNVGFMQILDPARIKLRVYERGVGETLACGSGACAAMACGRLYQGLASEVEIGLQGGQLVVSWQGEGQPVWMTGPATTVYKGQIEL